MIQRTVGFSLQRDGSVMPSVPQYGGVKGEHNVTTLTFTTSVPEICEDGDLVRMSFSTGDGTVLSTDLLEALVFDTGASKYTTVSHPLPQTLTMAGGQLCVRLVVSRLDENGKEAEVFRSGEAVLYFDEATVENGTPFWTGVSEMLCRTAAAKDAAVAAQEETALACQKAEEAKEVAVAAQEANAQTIAVHQTMLNAIAENAKRTDAVLEENTATIQVHQAMLNAAAENFRETAAAVETNAATIAVHQTMLNAIAENAIKSDAAIEANAAAIEANKKTCDEQLVGTLSTMHTLMSSKLNNSGHTPNGYLGTDERGNVVVVEAPTTAIEANTAAIGVNAVAIEANAAAIGVNAVAIEANAAAIGVNAVAIEANAEAIAENTKKADRANLKADNLNESVTAFVLDLSQNKLNNSGHTPNGYLGTDEQGNVVVKEVTDIPSWWEAPLQEGAKAINAAVEAAGSNKSAFLFYTDAHWGYGSGMSPVLLKYLGEHTALNKTVFGGDFGNTYEDPDTGKTMDDWMDVMRSWKHAVRGIPNHHSVVGNHDKEVTALSTDKALYGFLFAPEETNDIVRGGDFFYYVDDPNEKTRYIYLNTGLSEFDDAQCAFVIDALQTLSAGWHVVAVAHIWFVYDSVDTPTVGNIPTNTQKLLALLDAYNSRTSGNITIGTSHAYDFSECGGWVEFCIGGHTHVDHTFTSEMGIPVILCCTDSKHLRGSDYSYDAETSTEASVSGIVADYDAKVIKVVRVGRGASRYLAMTWYEVSYTNVLPTALAQDGSVYNAGDTPGYKKDTRWSSSGNVDQTQTGTYITAYIPMAAVDVFRLKNIVMPNATGNTCMLHVFQSLTDTSEGNVTYDNIVSSYAPVWDDAGNLVQFTIPEATMYSYVRIQCGGMDSTSVITVNESIE